MRIAAVIGLCILSIPGDWTFFAILFTLAFGTHHGDFKKQAYWFSVVSVIMVGANTIYNCSKGILFYQDFFLLGVFLVLPLLANYNGQRGGGKYGKWIFYIFYPAHLLILGMIIIFMKAH